jgi:hypothetical protein
VHGDHQFRSITTTFSILGSPHPEHNHLPERLIVTVYESKGGEKMKKVMAVIFLALFSATVAFGSVAAAGTPVPAKVCKKMHKHCGHKKAPVAKATPTK